MPQRIIKFRIVNTKNSRVYGPFTLFEMTDSRIEDNEGWYNQENTIFQQFTGLHDRNGKEIFEGDVVKLDSWNPKDYQISFIEGAFCLASLRKTEAFDIGDFVSDIHYVQHAEKNQSEITGNIYENPELLTSKEPRG